MKLSKHLLLCGMTVLTLGVTGALVFAGQSESKGVPVSASAADGYTTYYNTDLGFNSRNASANLVVIGDADGGMQTKGNVLDPKCELNLRYKNYNYDCWIGVGGYAVYISSGSQLRFLYLTHNDSGPYNRNVEKGGLVMKTADGSTTLTNVISGGKYFSDYLNVVYRWDLSNLSAVKASFHAIYNGVTYYPFDGSTRIDSITYTHQAINFSSSDTYRAMMGANAQDSGIDLIKFKTEEKKLDNMISFTASSQDFNYDYIGDFAFNFATSERIFSKGSDTYLNDHLNEFLDENSSPINLGSGILINGKPFSYWVNYSDSGLNYTSDTGVHQFPLSAGSTFNPVALQIQTSGTIKFIINTDYIPMDHMVITFKAGLFAGYYNGVKFTLSDNVTFYSTLEPTNSTDINHRKRSVIFTKTQSETVHTDYVITDASNNGVQTNSHGYNYYKFTLWTNIPRNTNINQGWSQDHYRYLYNNILLNGKSLSSYNSWARANSKDSTDEYETKHATGGPNTQFDLATQLQLATDQTNFVMFLYFPYQLMTDFGYVGDPVITLKEGSAWLTPSGVARIDYSPVARYAVEAFTLDYLYMDDYSSNLGYCSDFEHHYYLTAKQVYNALSANAKSEFLNNSSFSAAKARFEAWAFANGDANPYDGNNTISGAKINFQIGTVINDNSALLAAVLAIMVAPVVVCLFIKKRQHN